jgi:hypothetical protein
MKKILFFLFSIGVLFGCTTPKNTDLVNNVSCEKVSPVPTGQFMDLSGITTADMSIESAKLDSVENNTQYRVRAVIGNFGTNADATCVKAMVFIPDNVKVLSWKCTPSYTNTRVEISQHEQGYVLFEFKDNFKRCNNTNLNFSYYATLEVITSKVLNFNGMPSYLNYGIFVYNSRPDPNLGDNIWSFRNRPDRTAGCPRINL